MFEEECDLGGDTTVNGVLMGCDPETCTTVDGWSCTTGITEPFRSTCVPTCGDQTFNPATEACDLGNSPFGSVVYRTTE